MTEQQKTSLQSYVALMSDFVSEKIDSATFESSYLRKFKNEEIRLPEAAFLVLDRLFAEVDAYNVDSSNRSRDEIGDEELLSAAKTALSELARSI
jgi:hypothetical protein